MNRLRTIILENRAGQQRGIPSWCTAHPETLQSIFRSYAASDEAILIEATCNQVNQFGGYTGMNPAQFRAFVEKLAAGCGIDASRLILGGDHLGPNPWKSQSAQVAMEHARVMVAAFVEAGFSKLHLDCSMACADDRSLSEAEMAQRAAQLCAVAEASGRPGLAYVIGTEVPVPGGETQTPGTLAVTRPQDMRATWELHKTAFGGLGLQAAEGRIIAMVVQPGVDFGNARIHVFDRARAGALGASIADIGGIAFEAHSTDFQPASALAGLVATHCAILKVGPELTFAYRAAIFAMAAIEAWLEVDQRSDMLRLLDQAMADNPGHWQAYVAPGKDRDTLRLFGLSDRVRYYWPVPAVQTAAELLCANIDRCNVPPGLLWQYAGAVPEGNLPLSTRIIDAKIQAVIARYRVACCGQA